MSKKLMILTLWSMVLTGGVVQVVAEKMVGAEWGKPFGMLAGFMYLMLVINPVRIALLAWLLASMVVVGLYFTPLPAWLAGFALACGAGYMLTRRHAFDEGSLTL